MGRRWAALGAFVVVVLTAMVARAQARSTGEMTEGSSEARIAVHPGWAELIVRRSWDNATREAHRVQELVPRVGDGALVGFRVRVASEGRPPWSRSADLLGAAEAMERFRGQGTAQRGLAALLWHDTESGSSRLLVDAVPTQGRAQVELRYLLPTHYRGGRHHLAMPALGDGVRLLAEASSEGDLFVDGVAAQVVMARDGHVAGAELALAGAVADPISGELAQVPLGDGRHLVRYHIAVSPELGVAPREPHVVLLLDRSRSRHPTNLEHDRMRMIDYLDALPASAKVEVIPFDREPHPSFGRFVDRDTARDVVAQLSLERRHGSHLDRALELASERFAELSVDADRRLVVLTDARTRHAFSADRLNVGGALAHVVVTGAGPHGDPESHPWYAPIARTGGLIWFGGVAVEADSQIEHARPAMARLVRPTTLRGVELRFAGKEKDSEQRGDMDAGDGIERFDVVERALPWVEVEAKIWSRPVRVRLRPSPAAGRRAAALALHHGFDLTSAQRRLLAHHGHALSEHTSFVAAESGARREPSTLNAGPGSGRLSRSHRARPPRVRVCGVQIRVDMDEAREQLRAVTEHVLARCGAPALPGRRARLGMETTKEEIVDLEVTGLSKAQERCVHAALWDADLPSVFGLIDHERWDEDLSI